MWKMKLSLFNMCLIPVFICQQRRSVYALGLSSEVTRLKSKFLGVSSPRFHSNDSLYSKNIGMSATSNSQGYEINRRDVFRDMETDRKRVQDMLYRVRECNNVPTRMKGTLIDFVVDGRKVGKVTRPVADLLCNSSSSSRVFQIDKTGDTSILTLAQSVGETVQQRTESVMSVMKNLKEKGVINGWRDELYPLSDGFYNEPLFFVERAAAPFLGMIQYGVHINGLVTTVNGREEKMWIARRSSKKSLYPGMTDQLVAGGQPAGLSLLENVLKECEEEAGIPNELAMKGLKAAGAVSYETVLRTSHDLDVVTRAVLFNFDLYLPPDFKPTIVDGEVEEFFQWSIDEQFAALAKDFNDPMKPNCYLCVIDYLLRKGEVSPDTPGYLDVLRELRNGDCC